MPRDLLKLVLTAILAVYFLWCGYDPANAVFLRNINLAIYETGHLIFRLFGEFLIIAGGSTFQIVVPLVF